LALLDVELVHKPSQGNVVFDVLNQKQKLQVAQPQTKTQTLRAIFQREIKWKIKKTYVQNLFTQRYFKKL
jgi:hypothetical protein